MKRKAEKFFPHGSKNLFNEEKIYLSNSRAKHESLHVILKNKPTKRRGNYWKIVNKYSLKVIGMYV